ncbi:penicillin acylase family protein [Haliea salexigens]|uniref:penicillin acylase family protein n=1 Tax=Haliea salexigens TaxID=287487 RepID=UPI00040BA74F|nr:penicillin acylase family protein [Haliea salexigens]
MFLRRILLALGFAGVIAAGAVWFQVSSSAVPAQGGELALPGLSAPVTVLRDELGIPYIFAQNTPDLLRAQGFVTAQHRLFQMELFRATWQGHLAASIGETGLASDIRMRVLGIEHNSRRHTQQLSDASRAWLQPYVDGVNAYVDAHAGDHPLELGVVGLEARPWELADLVALIHFVHYTHATNFKAEMLAQQLADHLGAERAAELMPLMRNRNRSSAPATDGEQGSPDGDIAAGPPATGAAHGLGSVRLLFAPEPPRNGGIGSNNWAISAARSASGHAMLANDPHLDNRILPGMFHPVGLFAPGIQAVGATLPGLPGLLLGRTEHVAFGITNAYGDVQDVYVETLDPENPEHYLEGGRSLPLRRSEQLISVKDGDAPGGMREHPLVVRYTTRGPVISDHQGLGSEGDRVLVLRTTAWEKHAPQLGIEGLLDAPDAQAFDTRVQDIDLMMFNFVFADDQGNIGHRASGALPLRAGGDGSLPRAVPADGSDDWVGWIPKARMPGAFNPADGWVGTANHDTRPADFPWYYTNYVSPDYRYRRMGQVLNQASQMTVADHWALMADDRNLQSDTLLPHILAALANEPAQADLHTLLSSWDGVDRVDSPAPLIYQALYREIALGTFTDELGKDLAADMLGTWYFWQQRFEALLAAPDADWFDDKGTPARRETLDDVIRAAAPRARALLEELQGSDPAAWRWGTAHTLAFVSPLRPRGFGSGVAGGFELERSGSGETLNRGIYAFEEPFAAIFFASMKLVVDFADPDKVEAILAGGVVERHFQRHQNDQAHLWADGERRPWWFSPAQVRAHARTETRMVPD